MYHQPQIGWSAPTPTSTTFDSTVHLIIKMRRQNPAICVRHRLATDVTSVANELEAYTRMRLGIPALAPPALPSPMPSVGSVPVDDIKKIASGAAILIEWDKSNQPPVHSVLADSRALICAACPKNDVAKLEHWRMVPVAGALQSRTARITDMNLKTPSDAKLGLCDALFVPTEKLVHAPLAIINSRVKNRELLHNRCWLLTERAT